MAWRTILLVFAALGCACAIAQQPRYDVQFDAQTRGARVRLCLAHAYETLQLAADSAWAMRFIDSPQRSSGAPLAVAHGAWLAPRWQADECVTYRVDLAALAASDRSDVGLRFGDDLLVAPQLWLLRPDAWQADGARVRVALPPGWTISAPWQVLGDDAGARAFAMPRTPAEWSSAVAIGHFHETRIELPGGQLRVSILHGASAAQRTRLIDWVRQVSQAALQAYGRLPVSDVQVLVLPVAARGRAVVFGQSSRGGGNALQLRVDPTQPPAAFRDDWIAVHELAHLMHPALGEQGAWLAEGLATYYQNVLRARAGMLSATQAWEHLRDGFAQFDARAYDDTLAEASKDMSRKHDYQRVYWSGAAFWLDADIALRSASANRLSVDLALSRFQACCLPDRRGWKPREFMSKLDALLGTNVFEARFAAYSAARSFPDWRASFARLGLLQDAPDAGAHRTPTHAQVRDWIMRATRSVH